MAATYKLDAHGGSLVTDGQGRLVVILTENLRAVVTVKTSNPACALSGPNGEPASGWYVAWRVYIGIGGMTEAGVNHSAGEGQENTSETYTGTISPISPSVEVDLQLRAWRNTNDQGVAMYEYSPSGEIIDPGDIGFSVEVDEERFSNSFDGTDPSTAQGAWVDNAKFWRIFCTYDFSAEKWHIVGSIVD